MTALKGPRVILPCRLGQAAALTALTLGLSFGLAVPRAAVAAAADASAETSEQAVPEALLPPGVAGAYLAAGLADRDKDYTAAARYADRLMAAGVTRPAVLETAVQAQMALGDFAAAAKVAEKMEALGIRSQAARLAMMAWRLDHGQYQAELTSLGKGATVGPLVDGLVAAWADLGAGKMSEATAGFDRLTKTPGMQGFGLYHKALALASVGDFEGAEAILSGRDEAGGLHLTRRGLIAEAQVLSQLERNAEAVKLLDASYPPGSDPGIDALRDKLKAGETVPFTMVRTPRDGLAEVFFTVAVALEGQAEDRYTLTYARIAQFLRPDLTEATLLAAELLQKQGQYGLALAAYEKVGRDDPAYYVAEMGKADTLYAQGEKEAALDVMARLAKAYPKVLEVQVSYAGMLRQNEDWAEAVPAYGRAIDLITPDPEARFWVLYYMRGMSEERQGDWVAAEHDMRTALKLNPDQADVLNYLGYGLVERGEKLDEALALIKKAVAERPNDGYIADSLAWAYFRLGEYQKALPIMERASQLEPVDPVVTDHLGDVYWKVGRKLEARFQWRRALSYGPEEKDAERIRLKLEKGLDAVPAADGKAGDQNGG